MLTASSYPACTYEQYYEEARAARCITADCQGADENYLREGCWDYWYEGYDDRKRSQEKRLDGAHGMLLSKAASPVRALVWLPGSPYGCNRPLTVGRAQGQVPSRPRVAGLSVMG